MIKMNVIAVTATVLVLAVSLEAKVYSRCDFVHIARKNFASNEVADWTCLAQHESNFNSAAINTHNVDGSSDHGIFQINDRYWCSPGAHNACHVSCATLRGSDLAPSIKCAKLVKQQQGFSAWVAWNKYCKGKNLESYVHGC